MLDLVTVTDLRRETTSFADVRDRSSAGFAGGKFHAAGRPVALALLAVVVCMRKLLVTLLSVTTPRGTLTCCFQHSRMEQSDEESRIS